MERVNSRQAQIFRIFEKDGDWFDANHDDIQEKYADQFVAVNKCKVVAHDKDMDKLIEQLEKKRLNPAFTLVRFVPEKGVITIW